MSLHFGSRLVDRAVWLNFVFAKTSLFHPVSPEDKCICWFHEDLMLHLRNYYLSKPVRSKVRWVCFQTFYLIRQTTRWRSRYFMVSLFDNYVADCKRYLGSALHLLLLVLPHNWLPRQHSLMFCCSLSHIDVNDEKISKGSSSEIYEI